MEGTLKYEGNNTYVYYLPKSDFNFPIGVKVLNSKHPSPKIVHQFYNEYEILKDIDDEQIRKVLSKEKRENKHVIVFKWFDGVPLKEALNYNNFSLSLFLELSIEITKVLDKIHSLKIIHKDISPTNILVNVDQNKLSFIDFNYAQTFNKLKYEHLEVLEGSLNYMSPEQTGQINLKLDHRSDLYSLGIIFYEILTGILPYDSSDTLEIIHGHVAKQAPEVRSLNRNIPESLSKIVAKLIAKNRAERYQSASGLIHDLAHCQQLWKETKTIPSFVLGQNDQSNILSIPNKLFGRSDEIKSVINSMDYCAKGEKMLLLVSGYSGTGKSYLVYEAYKKWAGKSVYFAEGKFDQYERSIPYFAFIQAFKSLIDHFLTFSDHKLIELKQLILEALGTEGKVLTEIVPQLKLIIGEQDPVPELRGVESQNRFRYLIRRFINAVSSEDSPLVFFIDDLQWADSPSLELLKTILTDPNGKYLLCIGAFRSNEVRDSHPLQIKLNEIKKIGTAVEKINLGNLSLEHVDDLIKESIQLNQENLLDFSQLVYKKTQGNPFYLIEFLKSLYDESLLSFDSKTGVWKWDLGQIQLKNVTSNVVDLLADKFKNYAPDTLLCMKKAACIGAFFDIETLAIACKKDKKWVNGAIQQCLSENIVFKINNEEYKFSHDKFQQSFYSLIDKKDRIIYHYELGRLLLEQRQHEQIEIQLFDIVNHYNIGGALITDHKEKIKLATLNLRASNKAKINSAFDVGYNLAKKGIELLPIGSWDENYSLTLNLYSAATELSYLSGSFKKIDHYYEKTLENALTISDKIKVYQARISCYKAENQLMKAVNTGLEVVALLGVRFPKKIGQGHILKELLVTLAMLGRTSNEKLMSLPKMTDHSKRNAVEIMGDMATSAYWAYPNLLPLIIFKIIQLCLKKGDVNGMIGWAFGGFGMLLTAVMGKVEKGYTYGKLGLSIIEKNEAKHLIPNVVSALYSLTAAWKEHVSVTLQPLQESYHVGLETGQIEFACSNMNLYCIHSFLSGSKSLTILAKEAKSYSDYFLDFQQKTNYYHNEAFRQSMLNLIGESEQTTLLIGSAYDETVMKKQNRQNNDRTGSFCHHFNKVLLNYFFGSYDEALKEAEIATTYLDAMLGRFETTNLVFYEGLSCAALVEGASKKKKTKYQKKIKQHLKKLEKWSVHAPENYLHKYLLLSAENNRLKGRHEKARIQYDEAIQLASKNGFIQEEAVGCELAAKFYAQIERNGLSEYYYRAAYNNFREWGAVAKMNHLKKSVPHQLLGVENAMGKKDSNNNSESKMIDRVSLDGQTLIKVFTSISKEVKLDRLLNLLMQLINENAGASKGYLLLKAQEELYIEAQLSEENDEIKVLEHTSFKEVESLPKSVIQFVERKKENILLNDAIKDAKFKSDPYIVDNTPKSILCIPILNMGKFIGALYLENKLIQEAFTEKNIRFLNLLTGQIAVSIENANLYKLLEAKVEQRTQQLQEEKLKLDQLLYNTFPKETVEELKLHGKTTPRSYKNVTVMFADFVGFSNISSTLNPEEIVSIIDLYFREFDKIIDEHSIEKIKTIGDAYMCVGGLPTPNSTHAKDCVKAALKMKAWTKKFNEENDALGKPSFKVRIGLHSGPVVSGVVGFKKFAFDVWGDTVNVASRMESGCLPNEVNISKATYDQIKSGFSCISRGKVSAKNIGKIEMFFVEDAITLER